MGVNKFEFRIIGTLVSAILFVIGLAGVPRNLTTWFKWLSTFKASVPWWILILVSIVLAGLIWVPMIKWPTTLPQKIRYGDVIKLIHKGTGCSLHSHNISYSHNNTSGQQQVTAFAGADCNDYWTVNRPHGFGALEGRRRPVADHDIIRLDHQSTRKNLHSHVGHPSPITGQQEVTAYGTDGVGDPNDDWRIEVENGGEMARESAYPVDPRFVGMRSSLSQWAQPSTVYRWSAGSDGLYQQGRQRHLVRRKSA